MSALRFPQRRLPLDAKCAALLVVLLLDVLAAILVARQIVAFRDHPFDTDEAFHANGGWSLALDLRAGDWRAFVVDSYRQSAYPPGFSWMQAPVFLALGASPLVARMCSLASLLTAALILYVMGLELDEKFGWLVGLVAAALTLTSQMILTYAAMAMLEMPGLLVSLAALWAYLRASKQLTAWRLVCASLLMALTVLVKYPYGAVVVPTILMMEVLVVFPIGQKKNLAWRWLWLFGPFALTMIAWFAKPYKIAALFEYATSQPQQVALLSVENLVYYPRSLALHFAPSPIFALLMLAGALWAIVRWRDERPRLFLIYLLIGMLVMTVKLQKHPRFIATIAPAAHILTGAMLAWLAARWRSGMDSLTSPPAPSPRRGGETPPSLIGKGAGGLGLKFAPMSPDPLSETARGSVCWGRIVVVFMLVVCVASSVPVLVERFAAFPALMQVHYQTDPRALNLAAWIAAQVPHGQRFFLVNPWDQFSAPAMEWYLATRDGLRVARFADVSVPSVFLRPFEAENVVALQRAIRASGARYVVALEGGPEGEQVWPDYAQAMGEMLAPAAQQEFAIEQWRHSVVQWVKQSLLTRDGLERVKASGRYTMHIQATVYRVAEP